MKPATQEPVFRLLDADEGDDDEAVPPARPTAPPRSLVRWWLGLLWGEWFTHARLLLFFLFAWLAAFWLVPLVAHPLWILMVGIAYALAAGPAFGGADTMDGCEEFSFALPVTRRQRFLARLAMGGLGLLALTSMNVVALNSDLADLLLRVFLDSGLGGIELRRPELLYGLVFAFPFAVFALGFAVASLATGRTVAFTAWVWAAFGALATLRGAAEAEEAVWDRLNGRFTVPALLLVGAAALGVAGRFYARKEAGPGGTPLRMPLSWWGGLVLLLLAGVAVALLLVWLTANFARWM